MEYSLEIKKMPIQAQVLLAMLHFIHTIPEILILLYMIDLLMAQTFYS